MAGEGNYIFKGTYRKSGLSTRVEETIDSVSVLLFRFQAYSCNKLHTIPSFLKVLKLAGTLKTVEQRFPSSCPHQHASYHHIHTHNLQRYPNNSWFSDCHSPVDFCTHSCAYPRLSVLTPAHSHMCWCRNIYGRMTKAHDSSFPSTSW